MDNMEYNFTTLEETKETLIKELEDKKEKRILEETNVELLKKLINNAENITEALDIAGMGTIYKKTGLHFDRRLERIDDSIFYFSKNKNSFQTDKNAKTHKLIIGDNYKALLNLLISHKGSIDVIYIDPPYGKDAMGAFADTNYNNAITRDNLLSMLEPRLQLAKQLLSKTGVIFVSIDDRNQAYIKCLMDDVFGSSNFIENFVWVKNSTKNLSKTTSTNHEYIICYARNIEAVSKDEHIFRIQKAGLKEVKEILKKATEDGLTPEEAEKNLRKFYKEHEELKGISSYNKVDYGPLNQSSEPKCLKAYTLDNTSAPKATGKAATYEVIHPIDGLPCVCPASGWRYTRETMDEHIKNGLIEFYADHNHVPRFKRYLDTVETDVQKSVITDYTDGKKELNAIFGECPFSNPKPTTLIKTLLRCFRKDAVVLDFFAGSGTTGHAVLDLNREDGGDRTFILCTSNDEADGNIAEKVTLKRLKRIMTGDSDGENNFDWLTKNEPYGENLEVLDIKTVGNNVQTKNKSPFEVIDETLYGYKKFESLEEKINWVCNNFDKTQKYLEKPEDEVK